MRFSKLAALAAITVITVVGGGAAAFASSPGPGVTPMPTTPTTVAPPPTPPTTVAPTPVTPTETPVTPTPVTPVRRSNPAPTPEPAPEPTPEPEPVLDASCPVAAPVVPVTEPNPAPCPEPIPWAQLAALFAGGLLGAGLVGAAAHRRRCSCDDGDVTDGNTDPASEPANA